jgi:hypothetical protein
MTNQIPLEYVTSFADSNQAIMQQLTSALLTSGDSGAEFSRFAEVASVQQNYLAEMSALWVNALVAPAATPQKTDKSDRRFAGVRQCACTRSRRSSNQGHPRSRQGVGRFRKIISKT